MAIVLALVSFLGAIVFAYYNERAPPSLIAFQDGAVKSLFSHYQTFYGYRCTRGAHRGASTQHRENTLAALKAAEENPKYDFIEFDIQYSKDQRIVVYHDQRLFRLHGSLKRIGETSFAELSRLTNGEVVAYDEVVGLLEKKMNIEIKSQGDIRKDRRLVKEMATCHCPASR